MDADDDLLPLSGLQHVSVCPRQFALIHLECVWRENARTAEGRVLHERAHDPFVVEKRGDTLIARAVPLVSRVLGVSGEADVVEFTRASDGVALSGRTGLWRPMPVEYKRGKPKNAPWDEVQLCAQAMCLEEMLGVSIPAASLFYWEVRSRHPVALDAALRERTAQAAALARDILQRGVLPPARMPKAVCRACSLVDDCLPGIHRARTVDAYFAEALAAQAALDGISDEIPL